MKCQDCGGEDREGEGPEDIHEEWCPALTGMPRERYDLIRFCASDPAAAADRILKAEIDAARYAWLRDGNGYVPEEQFVRGGEELDELCDDGIAESKEERAAT